MMPGAPQHPAMMPPTLSSGTRRQDEPTWPAAVGIIMTIMCSVHLLSGVSSACSIVIVPLVRTLIPWFPDGPLELMERWKTWTLVSGAITLIVQGLGLAAGVGFYERLRWAPRLANIWTILASLLAVATTFVAALMQMENMKTMSQSTPANPMAAAGVAPVMAVFSGIITLGWQMALPVFVFIWLRRPRVVADISRW